MRKEPGLIQMSSMARSARVWLAPVAGGALRTEPAKTIAAAKAPRASVRSREEGDGAERGGEDMGWRGGKGWPFGRSLLKVDLYQVTESVDGVDLVDKIRIFDEDRGGVEVEQLRVEEDQLIHLVNVTVVEKAHDRIV